MTNAHARFNRLDTGFAACNNLVDILSAMEKALNPTDFVSAISRILHQIQAYQLLDTLAHNKLIPEHLLQKPVQPHQSCTGGASNVSGLSQSSNFSTETNIVHQGDCRPEMVTINSCSFDNNNEDGAINNEHCAQISRPRPELRNTANEFPISELQHVAEGMLQPDTTYAEFETEPKTSELFVLDSD